MRVRSQLTRFIFGLLSNRVIYTLFYCPCTSIWMPFELELVFAFIWFGCKIGWIVVGKMKEWFHSKNYLIFIEISKAKISNSLCQRNQSNRFACLKIVKALAMESIIRHLQKKKKGRKKNCVSLEMKMLISSRV